MSKCLHFIKSDSEYVQWVEFTKCLNSDMLLGCVYIPPENSKYSSEEAFIEIEDELLFFSRDHKNIALAGDFNSRTSYVSDIVELDDNRFDMLDISNVPEYFNVNMLSNYKLAEIGIPLERFKFSEDKARVNKYGQKLVEVCKRCSLYIANGRVYKDTFIGRNTCKDTSLVDYLWFKIETRLSRIS